MQTAEASALTALEQLEKDFITFVMYHTRTLTEAITYLKMKLGAFRARRRKYQIPKPPPHHYEGPVLSQDEMRAAFYASRAPSAPVLTPAELVRKLKVTLALPDGPNLTVPPEAVRVES
jgi:hypothetical protein